MYARCIDDMYAHTHFHSTKKTCFSTRQKYLPDDKMVYTIVKLIVSAFLSYQKQYRNTEYTLSSDS